MIFTLSLLIWISPYISKIFRVPTATVEIISGSLLAFGGILYHNDYFNLIAEVGFLYLMFIAGMEVNFKELTNSSKLLLKKAVMFVVSLGIMSIIVGFALSLNRIVIISLPLISVGLVASLSKIYGKKQKWLTLAMMVGVLGEIASITALTVLDASSSVGFGWELFFKILYLIIFLVAIFMLYRLLHLLFWWFPELKNDLVPQFDTSDQDIRMAMALFFILISIMIILHLELALGAFISGMAIAIFFYHKKSLEEKISSIGFGFLVPIFFIHVGVSFDLNALNIEILKGGILISTIMIILRVLASFYLRNIYTHRDALLVAFALSMPLTLLIAVATIGYTSDSIDKITYYQLILASLFEVLVAMPTIKILIFFRDRQRAKR
jgi:Kef-type K+ transport system membrane component KefB